MKQTELSRISGVPVSTLSEWQKTKPKLRALVELGAETFLIKKSLDSTVDKLTEKYGRLTDES